MIKKVDKETHLEYKRINRLCETLLKVSCLIFNWHTKVMLHTGEGCIHMFTTQPISQPGQALLGYEPSSEQSLAAELLYAAKGTGNGEEYA